MQQKQPRRSKGQGQQQRRKYQQPASGRLFHAVIMQSNPLGYKYRSIAVANFIGTAYKELLDCEDLKCLQSESSEELLHVQDTLMAVPRSIGDFFTWGPVLTDASYHRAVSSSSYYTSSSSSSFTSSYSSSMDNPLLTNITVVQPIEAMKALRSLDVPVLLGSNAHEGLLFVYSAFPATRMNSFVFHALLFSFFRTAAPKVISIYSLLIKACASSPFPDFRSVLSQILGDYLFRCPTQYFATQLTGVGIPVYLYLFQLPTRLPGFPACDGLSCHTCEIPFVFGQREMIDNDFRYPPLEEQQPRLGQQQQQQHEEGMNGQDDQDQQQKGNTAADEVMNNDAAQTLATDGIDEILETVSTFSTLPSSSSAEISDPSLSTTDQSMAQPAWWQKATQWIQSTLAAQDNDESDDSNNNHDSFAASHSINEDRGLTNSPLVMEEPLITKASDDVCAVDSDVSIESLSKSTDSEDIPTPSPSSSTSSPPVEPDHIVSRLMTDYWTTFAKYGDPNGRMINSYRDYAPGSRPIDAPWWPRLLGELPSWQAVMEMQNTIQARKQIEEDSTVNRRKRRLKRKEGKGTMGTQYTDGGYIEDDIAETEDSWQDFDERQNKIKHSKQQQLNKQQKQQQQRDKSKNDRNSLFVADDNDYFGDELYSDNSHMVHDDELGEFESYESSNRLSRTVSDHVGILPKDNKDLSSQDNNGGSVDHLALDPTSSSASKESYRGGHSYKTNRNGDGTNKRPGERLVGRGENGGERKRVQSRNVQYHHDHHTGDRLPKHHNRMIDFLSEEDADHLLNVHTTQRYMHQMVFEEEIRVEIIENDCVCNFWNLMEYRF